MHDHHSPGDHGGALFTFAASPASPRFPFEADLFRGAWGHLPVVPGRVATASSPRTEGASAKVSEMLAARACGRLAASRAVAASAVHRVAVVQHLGAAATVAPVRWHGSHGHSHGSARLPASSGPEQQRAARTVVSVGLLSDFMLTGVKGAAGWLTGSSALVSDAIHSAADMVVSMMAMVRAPHACGPMRAPPVPSHASVLPCTQPSHEVASTAALTRVVSSAGDHQVRQ